MSERSLEDLFADLVRARAAEKAANAERIACEQRILARVESPPERGRVKLEAGPVRCTVEFKLGYKADLDALATAFEEDRVLADLLPVKLIPAQPPSYVFDEKAYEALREKNPDAFARFSAFVTTKPAKPGLELKL